MIYPLGHDDAELIRLDAAALLLHDPMLDTLAAKAASCLEIGCGTGANFQLVRQANPDICYTGIDIAPRAVMAARERYHHDDRAKFYEMNGAVLQLNQKFDLVFTKLVLWSAGSVLPFILSEARRLLRTGGMFYALEPCNQLIQLYPPKPAAMQWMQEWDRAAIRHGCHPFIGTEIASHLIRAGFESVDCRMIPKISLGTNHLHYKAIINNLKGFYLGPAAEKFGLSAINSISKEDAAAELDDVEPESMVMDTLFAAWGKNP